MTNPEKLKNYLLGNEQKEGYLKSKLSNGKVILLSVNGEVVKLTFGRILSQQMN